MPLKSNTLAQNGCGYQYKTTSGSRLKPSATSTAIANAHPSQRLDDNGRVVRDYWKVSISISNDNLAVSEDTSNVLYNLQCCFICSLLYSHMRYRPSSPGLMRDVTVMACESCSRLLYSRKNPFISILGRGREPGVDDHFMVAELQP